MDEDKKKKKEKKQKKHKFHKFTVGNATFTVDAYYNPIKKCGTGAYGTVCSALDTRHNTKVAIKNNCNYSYFIMLAIQTDKLTKYYGEHLGMKNVSLEVNKGEVFGFVGPNGAGKSTAIRTLLGLLIPTSGSAKMLGMDVITQGDVLRKKVGYLPSEVNYYDEMSSRELLDYHSRFYGEVNGSEITRLAEHFELDLDREINELSFGNKKKCAIIQSVIHNPELLILDEPTAGLDPLMQNRYFAHSPDLRASRKAA